MRDRNPILVVEDDSAVRQVIAEILREAGHEVVECGSGAEALSRLESERFGLITLDLAMPSTDGLQLLRLLRERSETASLPVVIVTAVPESLRCELLSGEEVVVGKPFHMDRLLDAVRGALSQSDPVA